LSETINNVRKMSPFLLLMILVAFILSLTSLYVAVDSIVVQKSEDLNAYSFLAIGFFGLALSVYMLMQSKTATTNLSFELPHVVTTLECPKCDFKNIRDFQRGDYIFKQEGQCQKCQEPMKITAIYREPKKKNS
jgi:hypothetical protein